MFVVRKRYWTDRVWSDVWGRLQLVSKTSVVHVESCIASRFAFCKVLVDPSSPQKTLEVFLKNDWRIPVGLQHLRERFHRWQSWQLLSLQYAGARCIEVLSHPEGQGLAAQSELPLLKCSGKDPWLASCWHSQTRSFLLALLCGLQFLVEIKTRKGSKSWEEGVMSATVF